MTRLSVTKNFVAECLQWFDPRKIYCVDHALVPSIVAGFSSNRGHLLENLIFLHLRRLTKNIYYYRTQKGGEVDFVWWGRDGKKNLLQICDSLQKEETKERELHSLRDAMKELDVKQGTVVTFADERGTEKLETGIQLIPAWTYLSNTRNTPN